MSRRSSTTDEDARVLMPILVAVSKDTTLSGDWIIGCDTPKDFFCLPKKSTFSAISISLGVSIVNTRLFASMSEAEACQPTTR